MIKSLTPKQIGRLNKVNYLQSALYSARIEGNTLTLHDVLHLILKPKQLKIFSEVKNRNKTIPFDFLRRKFRNIPERTLRYNLKILVDSRLIIKIGKTNIHTANYINSYLYKK